ncbi:MULTISPECIES: 50S ribosomal protein L28 [Butyricimonas]|uniref:Large ribosomal subunit protein bL28 n=1 Tax=Butyricimonas hominis TaxID=2763032 RepID=A0ABR7CZ68_9BACT|nr:MULTISPECIES: 50S ribosomal protein L28 [Butyricimonas]MBC5620973.1 50S ribosomal protein L28 [Butyricimonas hominis]MCB6971053.1 50S ribosomal protein L28 [Butyricimonas synergistica]MCG4517767.1 50S ribosomal protein L28 [Butyricimonas sp. DFI.6.44]
MSRICQITGKKAMVGNHVSHSKRRVKRTFEINLFKRNFYWPEEERWVRLNVSAAGLRLINKKGINACLREATANGLVKNV